MLSSLLALLVAGQAASPAPATAGTMTPQQLFDTGSTAAADGKCLDALNAFARLEALGSIRRNALLSAAVDVRKGACLIRLHRADDGVAAINRGLPVLIAKGAEFSGDVRNARLALGEAAAAAFDYDAAAREYRAAVDVSVGLAKVIPLLRLSQVTMFEPDDRALTAANQARSLAVEAPGLGKKDVAAVQTQLARVMLNKGQKKEAYAVLKDSLSKQGGLDTTVTFSDIATRSDLAIAALLNNDTQQAQRYLAYTGAGRLDQTPFTKAVEMDPPVCGEGGLTPDDFGIVEFTLEDDGRVSGVSPIYVTGGRDAAIAFARAVGDWSWRSEDVAKIPMLFRYTTRVEIRCVKTADTPSLTAPLGAAVDAWFEAQGAPTPKWEDASEAAAFTMQKAALTTAQARGDTLAVLQASAAIITNAVASKEDIATYVPIAEQAATALKAPAAVTAMIAIAQARASDKVDRYRDQLRSLLQRPDIAGDPLSADTVRMLVTRPSGRSDMPDDAPALLDAVIADPALAPRHPLKIAALLSRANLLARKKDMAAAQASFAQTGLSAEQCSLLGMEPAMRRSGASADSYPMDAMRLGFEGWARSEFDVAADGRTIAPRVIVSYPPFVFDDAATKIASGARYASTYRPEGALACSGQQQQVRFMLP